MTQPMPEDNPPQTTKINTEGVNLIISAGPTDDGRTVVISGRTTDGKEPSIMDLEMIVIESFDHHGKRLSRSVYRKTEGA